MRKLIIIFTISTLLFSCLEQPTTRITSKMELRQLVNTTQTSTYSKGSFFLLIGSYSSGSNTISTIKLFANTGPYYKFLEIKLSDVRINIDNDINTPTLQIQYKTSTVKSIEELTSWMFINEKIYIINCPEKYLPKKLLPIELK